MTDNIVQGALFTIMVMRVGDASDPTLEQTLRNQITRSPQFFANAPIVLDLKDSRGFSEARDFTQIMRLLRRSGTQIYAPGGDVIIVRSVSAGAEIIADGNIHVYGALRGRAIAGATGDAAARIFVGRLEAELVSIAGRYLVREDIAPAHVGQRVQVVLEEKRVVIIGSG